MKRLKTDPWFNALQVKYAYGVTCHKAQGGQWKHVYVDMGYILRCGFARFLSLALYGFHPGDREDMAGQYERRVSGAVFIIQGSITS